MSGNTKNHLRRKIHRTRKKRFIKYRNGNRSDGKARYHTFAGLIAGPKAEIKVRTAMVAETHLSNLRGKRNTFLGCCISESHLSSSLVITFTKQYFFFFP
jgi:hypothetical protein